MKRREKVWCLENRELFKDLLIERRKLDTVAKIQTSGVQSSVFQKHGKIHILKSCPNTLVRHRVVRVPYLRLFFVQWLTNLTWCELPGWYRSMIMTVFLVPESWSRSPIICCIWSWTCLAALDDFDVVGVQKWTTLSHGAPVQLLFQILGLSSAWWRIGSHRNITLLSLLAISKSSANTRRSIYARPAC